MPESAPEKYKKLAERCCDADPDKRPNVGTLQIDLFDLSVKFYYDDTWDFIYYNNVEPLSSLERGSKYSGKLLSTDDLSKLITI